MFTLKLLGGASLEGDAGPLTGPAVQRHRLALLALLAAARGQGVSRDKLVAWLWPESDAERARGLLKQAVHAIRRALGPDAILSAGDELRLNPAVVASDLEAFEQAAAAGDAARAVAVHAGPFLDGFFLGGSNEFERWADGVRERVRASHAAMLEALAEAAEARGAPREATAWWRRLAAESPGNSRVALRLMTALAAAGDRAAAIRHAQVHAALLRDEFGAEPDPDIEALVRRLREEAPARKGGSASRAAASAQGELPAASPSHAHPAASAQGEHPAASPSHAHPGTPALPHDPAAPPSGESTRAPVPTTPHATSPVRVRRRTLVLVAFAALAVLVVLALTRWPARPDRSLAVLPFLDLSGDPGDAYLGDGMTEELIHTLSGVDGLRVIARTSAFQFRGQNVDVRDVGRRLDVALVLEGSVRRSGERVRVTAQLIRTDDGSHLWSEVYERDVGDVLAMQEDIARAIAGELRLRLTDAPVPRARHSSDREAYHLYLKGAHARAQSTPAAVRQAITYFQQAVARDSAYALAWAGLAHAYAALVDVAAVAPGEALPPARAAALRALALDPSLPEAHAVLGWLHTESWEWDEAKAAFERAFALGADRPETYLWYSLYLDNMSRFEEALDATRRAQQLDPLSPSAGYNVVGSYLHLARFEPAIEEAHRLVELHPNVPLAYDALGWALVDAGRPAEAIAPLEKAVEMGEGRWLALANLGRAYALVGRRDDARAVLARLERDWGDLGFGNFAMAAVHVALDERDQALARLADVYRLRHAKLPHARQWSAFEPLYGDPRFSQIVRDAGYEPPAR